MTIQEAAAELDVTIDHVARLIRQGAIRATPYRKNGKRIWILKGQDVRKRRRLLMSPRGRRLLAGGR